jgi:tetratricopeptide (TPR) repeat protein
VPVIAIQHVPESDPPQFEVVRLPDGKRATAGSVPSPVGHPVEGRPQSDLRSELAWYLEQFLDYPFPPETEHAERVEQALNDWGRETFAALFSTPNAIVWFHDAIKDGLDKLDLRISSDDPRVLAWPWEALADPQTGTLAHTCRIERRLNNAADPPALSASLPQDRVNVLLVTARPNGERDVRFRSISRPLIELVESRRLPVEVTLLRPPTFEELRRHLLERPGYYHILHFDGHGVYGPPAASSDNSGNPFTFRTQGPQGQLAFETDDGGSHLLTAGDLAVLLREARVPAVVLNACQSAMIDEQAEDAFASVAAALVQAGVRRVAAMSYSLYVSAAREFLPEFYERLFASGSFQEAVRAGRQKLLFQPQRICARGRYPLSDWLVPVVYAQDGGEELSFAATAARAEPTVLPEELTEQEAPYGLIGRDGPLLLLERAMHRAPGVLLITGLGGVGKTTLAAGFAEWLIKTGGLEPGRLFWFRFDEIHSAEFVFNRLGERLFGPQFATLDLDEKRTVLVAAFKEHRCLIVWDNFESVHGIAGTAVTAKLSADGQQQLAQFARELRGGRTKILLTSRSDEPWLEKAYRFRLELSGLDGEERWEFCETILRELGKQIDRSDPELVKLMQLLAGHPLAMRIVLPELESRSAGGLLKTLAEGVGEFETKNLDPTEAKLFATLRFATDELPEDLKPLLVPLALHDRFADANALELMARQVDAARWPRARIDACLQTLSTAGLARDCGQGIYELHPLLTRYLRACVGTDEAWTRAFVVVFASLANHIAPKDAHEQRILFYLHSENFHTARREAETLRLEGEYCAITQFLALCAKNSRDFDVATSLIQSLAMSCQRRGREDHLAATYYQLGTIEQDRWNFAAAEDWYQQSLEISERLGNEEIQAGCYHQLGRIAEQTRTFDLAKTWYDKALEISERLNLEQGVASIYHNLGSIAMEMHDLGLAEAWYSKSLDIKVRLDDQWGLSLTYHQLGILAKMRADFITAKNWHRKSLTIKQRFNDEHGAAATYHELGIIAQDQGDFPEAEKWYHKSLEIEERIDDEIGAAITCHQLGRVAHEYGDAVAAESWYQKAVDINERLENEPGAANNYHQLGIILQQRGDLQEAENWYRKALLINEQLDNKYGAASAYGQLGLLTRLQKHYFVSAQWFVKANQVFHSIEDTEAIGKTNRNFGIAYSLAPPQEREAMRAIWTEAGLPPLPEVDAAPQ